ncbi:hypothetical protein CTA1_761 [Colletotrichum tanaceti]|uniref:Uncharacterized protein n=1 Tax=Colletotrichum tanaceti TaxID=1306861 RepID=A0A4U6XQ93_9PEZI|nr:hypothetical protein CTA1_761 [Colletotrichum tanaceti]
MKLAGAFAILSAVLVAAAPTPQGDEPAAVFGISFTFENGTFTDVFDGSPPSDGALLTWSHPLQTASNGIVTNVFIYPPPGQPARCAFLEPEPSRQGLGAWVIARATTIALDPPGEVGFVQCNRA